MRHGTTVDHVDTCMCLGCRVEQEWWAIQTGGNRDRWGKIAIDYGLIGTLVMNARYAPDDIAALAQRRLDEIYGKKEDPMVSLRDAVSTIAYERSLVDVYRSLGLDVPEALANALVEHENEAKLAARHELKVQLGVAERRLDGLKPTEVKRQEAADEVARLRKKLEES